MQGNNKSKKFFRDSRDTFQQLRILSKCYRTGYTVLQRVKRQQNDSCQTNNLEVRERFPEDSKEKLVGKLEENSTLQTKS